MKTVIFLVFCTISDFAEIYDHNLTSTKLVKSDAPRYVFASLSLVQSEKEISRDFSQVQVKISKKLSNRITENAESGFPHFRRFLTLLHEGVQYLS